MKRNNWNALTTLALAVACVGYEGRALAQAPKNQTNAAIAFEKLKTLVGHWEATTDKGPASVTYELVSDGTALLEREDMSGHEGNMITVYHLDGDRLVLTHYCKAGNQPRMQAQPFDPKSNEMHFDFVGATNLSSSGAGHMHQVLIRFALRMSWRQSGRGTKTARKASPCPCCAAE